MSTVDPGVNIRMGEALAPKGIDFVDAPVMGSPSGVGSWAFALGGSDEALAEIKDVLLVLSRIGRKTVPHRATRARQ